MSSRLIRTLAGICLLLSAGSEGRAAEPADVDLNGYVDLRDYEVMGTCLDGPDAVTLPACATLPDRDQDGDSDLADFANLSNIWGHLPMPLRGFDGDILTAGSANPYSGIKTCGACHGLDFVTGAHYQQGRADSSGNVVMKDDYFGDGRPWVRSGGRYGQFSQAALLQHSGKSNPNESAMDLTAFTWIRDCGGCHPGSGPGQFDRDGELYYDFETGEFGYEKLGKTAENVRLDGDYAEVDPVTGLVSPARWDVTGLSEPDCLLCHRSKLTIVNGVSTHREQRQAVLASGVDLVDNAGQSVRAFSAAGTAAQGWYSTLDTAANPPRLQIDYSVGLANGSLLDDGTGGLALPPATVDYRPTDHICWSCHKDFAIINGTVWFDERDVHYRRFNRLHDAEVSNDVPSTRSRACLTCHPGFAKGNSPQIQTQNDQDFVGFRTCRDCHLSALPNGDPNSLAHPDAPHVPGAAVEDIHRFEMFNTLSCQFCHIPSALNYTLLFIDPTPGGSRPVGVSGQYLSADPLNPGDPDKSTWYPAFVEKTDADGADRWFPVNFWPNIFWADWQRNGTPTDLTDDIVAPIISWRINQVVGSQPLPGLTDDNGDGVREVNRPAEILAYLQALKQSDDYGRQVAANPVLIKGNRMWLEDATAPEGVSSVDIRLLGLPVDWYAYIWELDHNVAEASMAWGAGGQSGCEHCHVAPGQSPVFDRKILVDPYGADGQPVYETVRQMTGINPPF